MGGMLVHDVVATSQAVGATRSRKAKVAALAELLGAAAAERAADVEGPEVLRLVTSWLGGSLRQRRTGVGWRTVATLPEPAAEPTLTVVEVDAAFEQLAGLAGPGSQGARAAGVAELFGRATEAEQRWLRGLVTGEVRQGALDALVQEAVAVAAEVPLPAVRRAAMLCGSTVEVVEGAFVGGEAALAEVRLEVGRPISPMLASSAPSVAEGVAALRKADPERGVVVEAKLDGIRVQAHRDGDDVLLVTRSLDPVTDRLPEVVEAVRALPVRRIVLDGEVLALDDAGRPRAFQDTASRTAQAAGVRLTPFFFDVLAIQEDGSEEGGEERVLLDAPAAERLAVLDRVVPPEHRVDRLETTDPDAAQAFADEVLARGHEGVVLKGLDAPYAAGRRGAAWVKVKPVHTLDLVVLAVEWGSGRRRGLLSNLHLGARDETRPEGFVMLGKTFKGMTDEMLAWQTERFLALETHREDHVVHVRPGQVVEIAFDGLQRSTRYPGGVALRFARVVRYREDKTAGEADTIEAVRDYLTSATGRDARKG